MPKLILPSTVSYHVRLHLSEEWKTPESVKLSAKWTVRLQISDGHLSCTIKTELKVFSVAESMAYCSRLFHLFDNSFIEEVASQFQATSILRQFS